MNSQQAQAAAKAKLPVMRTDKAEYRGTVFKCINEVTFVYRQNGQIRTRVCIEYLQNAKWEENVPLEYIAVIDNCEKCPNSKVKSKDKCERCSLFSKAAFTDCFACEERETCPEFKNECKGYNGGRLCVKYGQCTNCENLGEDICCDDCIHAKNKGKAAGA